MLPQELWDNIYTTVLPAPRSKVRNVNSPSLDLDMKLLHISQDSRAVYAVSFYNAEFDYDTDMYRFVYWLVVLPEAHRNLLQKVVKGGDHLDLAFAWKNMMQSVSLHDRSPIAPRYAWIVCDLLRDAVKNNADRDIAAKVFVRIGDEVFGNRLREEDEWNGR